MSTLSAPSRLMPARGLGDHKHSSTSTGTITLMAQSVDPSATSTPNLFPTTTAGRGDPGTGGPGSANVYYLVFLGVLVIILMLAACLAFRAFRMRRRYRTATQIALARGDPLPMQLRDDYWGLAGLPGFPHGTDGVGGGGVITGESRGKKGTWTKIPILEEAEVDGMAPEYRDELFEDITPVTLHSLLAPPDPSIAIAEAQSQFDLDQAGFSPTRTRRFQLANLRRLANPSSPGPYNIPEMEPRPRTRSSRQKEIDRVIQEGEEMRLAVVIQMPTQQDKAKKRQSWGSDEDEEVAWETGMELGVWEGTVGR